MQITGHSSVPKKYFIDLQCLKVYRNLHEKNPKKTCFVAKAALDENIYIRTHLCKINFEQRASQSFNLLQCEPSQFVP